jgi:hypothetical protein
MSQLPSSPAPFRSCCPAGCGPARLRLDAYRPSLPSSSRTDRSLHPLIVRSTTDGQMRAISLGWWHRSVVWPRAHSNAAVDRLVAVVGCGRARGGRTGGDRRAAGKYRELRNRAARGRWAPRSRPSAVGSVRSGGYAADMVTGRSVSASRRTGRGGGCVWSLCVCRPVGSGIRSRSGLRAAR